MNAAWQQLLAHEMFMPHGHCYLWQPALVWLQVLTNGAIGLAYVAISCMLAGLVYKIRDDLPFRSVYLAFGTFIVSCGITHFFDILVIWTPVYWMDGAMRAVTALASVGTALMLPPLLPRIRNLARAARAAVARGIALETAVRDLESMYQKSREVERVKTQFFANMSHELRTPLTLILGPLDALAQRRDLPLAAREQITLAQRNARILLRQVADILDSAKLEAGMDTLHRAHLDVAVLVRQNVEPFVPVAHQRQISLRVNCPSKLMADLDGDKVERILLNLLSNAFKHTPHDGTGKVVCQVRSVGQDLVLEVRNSGAPIPPQARQQIFERFTQRDDGAAHAGTGLGLAIVHDCARLHGGTVEVNDAAEGGARFIVILPLRAPADAWVAPERSTPASDARSYVDALFQTPAAASADLPAAAVGHLPRVLLAEDNVELNHFLCSTLRQHYTVDTAVDGKQALAMARRTPPDLIISDWMMPNMTGESLLTEVRADAQLCETPFLLMTARNQETDRVAMLERGAHDYLAKPFHLGELLARVANLVALKRTRDVLERSMQPRPASPALQTLEDLATQLQAAKQEAERLARAKADFVNMVAHELRSPLAAIGLQIARLLRMSAREQLHESFCKVIQQLEAGAGRLSRLLDTLLMHDRAEAGKLALALQEVNVQELVQDVVDELTPLAAQQRLVVHQHMDMDAQTPLQSDPTLMRIIVRNLLSNAIKFTQPGGFVEISTNTEANKTVIAVRDNGPGIRMEDHDQVFQPFVHLEPIANKHTPGMGLGLSLVRTMTHALGGHVELSSRQGGGSTFRVVLGLKNEGRSDTSQNSGR